MFTDSYQFQLLDDGAFDVFPTTAKRVLHNRGSSDFSPFVSGQRPELLNSETPENAGISYRNPTVWVELLESGSQHIG